MASLPRVVATSVIRSAHEGESHGGVYMMDLSNGACDQVVRWDFGAINWEGRGSERGLRGIAFTDDLVIVAASDEVILYDKRFNVLDSYTNAYLKHCHEIIRAGDLVWLTSTGFDCVLGMDLHTGRFVHGYQLKRTYPNRLTRRLERFPTYSVRRFDPEGPDGPRMNDRLHLNNVWVDGEALFVCGTELRHLVGIRGESTEIYAHVPKGTHNARPFGSGVIANHTERNRIAFMTRKGRPKRTFQIRTYDERALVNASLPSDHARQAFGRGLCVWDHRLVIGGSSPATISVFDFVTAERVASFNITMDVRNAIHGLEVWPF